MRLNHNLITLISLFTGQTVIAPAIRDSGEIWKVSIITFVADIFRGASCFHAVLIVLLRCVAIIKPMSFKTWHKRLTWISIAVIWIYLLVICLTPTAITTEFFTTNIMPKKNGDAYGESWQALYHGTLTVPIVLILIMCLFKIYILKDNSTDQSEKVSEKKKSLAKMTTGITVVTLICNVPFIIWTQYNVAKINNNTAHEVLNTTAGVS